MNSRALPCFLPAVDLRSGRTTDLELLSSGMLSAAVEVASAWWAQRPDVGLLLTIEVSELDALLDVLDGVGADRGRVAVQVPASRLADAAHVQSLGLRLTVGELGAGPVDLAALCALRPSLVRVDASAFTGARGQGTLAAGVALGHTAGAAVLATSVDTVADLHAAGRSGADAAQGLQAAPLLVGPERTLAHLADEGIAEPAAPVEVRDGRLDQLAASAARIESLVSDLSDSIDRRASSAAPRSARSGPRAR